MKKLHLYRFLCVLCIVAFQSCGGIPKDALNMARMSLEERQLQTRLFDTPDEREILSAAEKVFQDLGFKLDELETDLGLIVGSQNPDAVKTGHIILSAIADGLNNIPATYSQKIRVSVVTSPAGEDVKKTSVRVTFQRIVWDNYGQISKFEKIDVPELYQGFFKKLYKEVFPEARESKPKSFQRHVKISSTKSRIFDTADNIKTLRAIITTLQDLGFVINKADNVLGSVSATKLDHHDLTITVDVRFHREAQIHVLANAKYNQKAIESPEFYNRFFTTLEKAMFSSAKNK